MLVTPSKEIIRLHGNLKFRMELPAPGMPIEDVPAPKNVILPLSAPPGIFCRPIVEKGDSVFKGDKIGEDPTNRMTPIHSPVSGKVTDINTYRFAQGGDTLSMFIESDDQEAWKTEPSPFESFTDAEPSELIKIIRDAGVRIIPFETLPDAERNGTKISPIRHFVINGIGHGFVGSIARQLLLEKCADLLEGVSLIKRIFRPEKIYLVINEKHEDVIRTIRDTGLENTIGVIKLYVHYPFGHPHLLFKTIFGKEIPCPGGKAIDMGAAFADVDTVIQALEAVKLGKPLIERYVTVSGEGIRTPKNLRARIGTPVRDLIEFCGGFKGKPGRLALGNPLGGMAQLSLDTPILKDTGRLWVQPQEQVLRDKYRACINCGDCVDVCPVQLMPNLLGKFCEFYKYDEAAHQYDLWTCIECGLCAYVCPSRRPLVHFISLGKRELTLKEKENANG